MQLNVLFDEIDGFNEFMIVIASNTLRDSVYGMMYRVSVGAALSTIDAATDIYVITTYYASNELHSQGNALLAMITSNMIFQLLIVQGTYQKKSWETEGGDDFDTLPPPGSGRLPNLDEPH